MYVCLRVSNPREREESWSVSPCVSGLDMFMNRFLTAIDNVPLPRPYLVAIIRKIVFFSIGGFLTE
jgi:hypothetical protein